MVRQGGLHHGPSFFPTLFALLQIGVRLNRGSRFDRCIAEIVLECGARLFEGWMNRWPDAWLVILEERFFKAKVRRLAVVLWVEVLAFEKRSGLFRDINVRLWRDHAHVSTRLRTDFDVPAY